MPKPHQKLPVEWKEREALRDKGQFWTPDWVARAMVRYVLAAGNEVYDPAVGAGAFLIAAKALGVQTRKQIQLRGSELHSDVLAQASSHGLTSADLRRVRVGDFLRMRPTPAPTGIVANPPYIRHHRLAPSTKRFGKALSLQVTGFALDGRAGYHVYFLIHALSLLPKGGRLAFIVPSDTCEGVFARPLWRWIAKRFRIDGVVTFRPEATPFPGVDTNPVVLMISRREPLASLVWARCGVADSPAFERWVASRMRPVRNDALAAVRRSTEEALVTGLTRAPAETSAGARVLGDFVRVMRGIATGANGYFHLTAARAAELGIPDDLLVTAIGRTRDVAGDRVTREDLEALSAAGRPTLLFSPDGRPLSAFPRRVRDYLRQGTLRGLPKRALIGQRKPWYRMERRDPPPFLFAYLGRRNARFIRNDASVRPLTGFLCVYPRTVDGSYPRDRIWRVLSDPRTVANLAQVGKSYGGGAIKVEPRALERLPLPADVLVDAGLVVNDAGGSDGPE